MAQSEPFVYFGTSAFSSDVLEGLLKAGLKPVLVVTTAGKPAGRGLRVEPTPVGELTGRLSIPIIEVASLKPAEVEKQLAAADCSYAVLAAFGKIIPPAILSLYPKGIVNVHPSLLPLYRGPSPIQAALRSGGAKTGVSLIVLDSEVDHGPVLAQRSALIDKDETAPALSGKLASLAVELLCETLPPYLRGELKPREQDHTLATFTKMIRRADGQVDFNKSAIEIERQARAYDPWPGLWSNWRGRRLKLLQVKSNQSLQGERSVVGQAGEIFFVGCGQGVLELEQVQLEGGRAMPIPEFVLGHSDFVGSKLV